VAELKKVVPLQPAPLGLFSPALVSIGSGMLRSDSGVRIGRALSRENSARSPFLAKPSGRAVVNAYRSSKKRLIIFEYDGVLVPFAALPSLSRPPRKLMANLRTVVTHPGTSVFVFSGRDRKTLDSWFPLNTNLGLSAEQGYLVRKAGGQWEQMLPSVDLHWREMVRPILDHYTVRTPGTFVEETEVQLVWHHRNAEEPFGSLQVRELHHLLDEMPVSLEVRDKRLAVKPINVNQSLAFRRVFADLKGVDFLLVVGEFNIGMDAMDLPENSFIYGIGKSSKEGGRWNMTDTDEVNDMVSELATAKLTPI